MFLFLTLAALSHITIGFFSSIFVLSYYVFNLKSHFDKRFILGFLAFTITVLSFVYTVIGVSKDTMLTGKMNFEDWYRLTRMACYHWYPLAM